MDYEEKYKEVLERAEKIYHSEFKPDEAAVLAEYLPVIFPELKESENERIRKEIIDFLRLPHPQFVGKRDHEKWIAWLEKQGEKSNIIDIDKMVMEYSQTKDGDFGLPVNCMIRAYRKGINDALSIASNIEKQGEKESTENTKTLDADKVIEWLKPYSVIVDNIIEEFKKDFGL